MPNVSEIKEFWIPLHGLTPPRSSLQPQDDTSDVETEDDWRTFLDTPDPSTVGFLQCGTGLGTGDETGNERRRMLVVGWVTNAWGGHMQAT